MQALHFFLKHTNFRRESFTTSYEHSPPPTHLFSYCEKFYAESTVGVSVLGIILITLNNSAAGNDILRKPF